MNEILQVERETRNEIFTVEGEQPSKLWKWGWRDAQGLRA